MKKKVIVIGAGIGGLAAGCYGQMNGYDTHVFEMHDKPGGLCTAWNRKGYTVDGCLHWLCGSSPGSSFYHFWEELGMIQGQKVIDPEIFDRFETHDGTVLSLYTDVDRLESHLKEIAPEDSSYIDEIADAIRRFGTFKMPADKAPALYTPADTARMVVGMIHNFGLLRKWGKMTMKDFATGFKSPVLREAFMNWLTPEFSAVAILITLAYMNTRSAGYVIGGSMSLSRAIEKRYLSLGGQLTYKAPVTRILVENNRAVGIMLNDGSEHKADYVVSAADGYATIFGMLDGKYADDTIRGYYKNLDIFQPLVYVGLGVNRTFDELPDVISGNYVPLHKPVYIGGVEHKYLNYRIHKFDPTLAPAGKTVITCMIDTRYRYWEELQKDRVKYNAEKDRIAGILIATLDKRFPGIAAQVEMRDVATPVTFRRYTGNWQGSFEGWMVTPKTMMLRMKNTLPGLDNFYMAGQWVQPGGGLPGGVMTGSYAIQMLCKKDGKKYTVSKPDTEARTASPEMALAGAHR